MSLSNQFETLLNSAKQVEDSLNAEKAKNQKVAQQYIELRKKYEETVKQAQQKLREKDYEIENMKDMVADAKIAEEKLKNHVLNMSLEEKKLRDELSKYEDAHEELMARDNEARATLLDNGKLKQTIAQLSAQIQGAHEKIIATREMADNCQKQFQSAVSRAQAAEGQLKRLEVELQQARDAQMRAEKELRELAPQLREQSERRVEAEREKAKLEVYQESAGKLERIRDENEARIREIEERMTQKLRATESERDRLMHHLRELSTKATEQLGRAKQQVEAAESARLHVSTSAQQMLDTARFEATRIRLEMEELKKETNRVLIIERLQHQKESERLKAQIQTLESALAVKKANDYDSDTIIEKWTSSDLPKYVAVARPIEV